MLVRVAQLFEDGGRRLPRHRTVTIQPALLGKLKLTEQYDSEFRRSLVFATLCGGAAGDELIPRLHDAVVRFIGDGCMTISGFQIDGVTRRCSVQSWYVQVVSE